MKRIYLVLLGIVLLLPNLALAQSNNIRSLAASQLFIYGQAVYDRGDLSEAAKVLSKVLAMEPTNPKALKIAQQLKNKGYDVYIPVVPVSPKPVQKVPEVIKAAEDPNKDLKDSIQQVDDQIEHIRKDVSDLKGQMGQSQKDVI